MTLLLSAEKAMRPTAVLRGGGVRPFHYSVPRETADEWIETVHDERRGAGRDEAAKRRGGIRNKLGLKRRSTDGLPARRPTPDIIII